LRFVASIADGHASTRPGPRWQGLLLARKPGVVTPRPHRRGHSRSHAGWSHNWQNR